MADTYSGPQRQDNFSLLRSYGLHLYLSVSVKKKKTDFTLLHPLFAVFISWQPASHHLRISDLGCQLIPSSVLPTELGIA